ncbi:MAG: hypothetical protein PHS14_10470 [Elusimicrobia bacterium]|nr:hypothetical protein [Elusimicrobiota bacterium]
MVETAKVSVETEGGVVAEVVEDATATVVAVETKGAAAAVSVETDGGSGEGGVPEDTVCPRADDDSAAAAITLIRKLFTGLASILKRVGPLRRGPLFLI